MTPRKLTPKPRTATYLYCLVHGKTAPSLKNVPPGLPLLGPPRLLPAGPSMWIVAADAPLSRYGKAPIEAGLRNLDWVSACAVAHEQVIEHFARTSGAEAGAAAGVAGSVVVPLKLFTLFATDARAVAHIVGMRAALTRLTRKLAGCREWGVRIRLAPAPAAAPRPKASRTSTPGTSFLLSRKQAQDRTRLARLRAAAQAEAAYRTLSRIAREATRLGIVDDGASPGLILNAAFLVPRKSEARFRAAVRQLTTRSAELYDVLLTGPWPPYNFIEVV